MLRLSLWTSLTRRLIGLERTGWLWEVWLGEQCSFPLSYLVGIFLKGWGRDFWDKDTRHSLFCVAFSEESSGVFEISVVSLSKLKAKTTQRINPRFFERRPATKAIFLRSIQNTDLTREATSARCLKCESMLFTERFLECNEAILYARWLKCESIIFTMGSLECASMLFLYIL